MGCGVWGVGYGVMIFFIHTFLTPIPPYFPYVNALYYMHSIYYPSCF